MLSVTLHQMRTGWVRLIAAGLAIMLGTGFVAASMLGGEVMKSAAYQSFTSDYAGADLVVGSDDDSPDPFPPQVVEAIAAADGVAHAQNKAQIDSIVESGAGSEWAPIGPVTESSADSLTEGALPDSDSEVALSADIARRLTAEIGDEVAFTLLATDPQSGGEQVRTFTVTGLLSAGANLFSGTSAALIPQEAFSSPDLQFATSGGPVALQLEKGADAEAVIAALSADLGDSYRVETITQLAEETMEAFTGATDTMRNLLLGFAGVALAVAALVIGNTFAVLVAQRTRHLALLRTVGASRGQVRRSVLLEALLLGLAASIAGVLLGYGVIAAAIAILTPSLPGINLWQGMTFDPTVWIVTLLTGLLLTLIAGWAPARSATKVRPLEALRPEPVRLGSTAGKFRAAVSALAFVGGVALLVGGVLIGRNEDPTGLALAMGILGGFTSVFGVVLGSVFVITPLVRLVGRLFGRGVPAMVATMGAVRNPRRTATTTNALFIGVGLVAMMSTGAATAKATLDHELEATFPVDMEVAAISGDHASTTPISAEQIEAAAAIPDVSLVVPVEHTLFETTDGWMLDLFTLTGAVPEGTSSRELFDAAEAYDSLSQGDVLVPEWLASDYGIAAGDTLEGTDGVSLHVVGVEELPGGILTSRATLEGIDAQAPVRFLWIGLADDADAAAVLGQVEDALSAADGPVVSVYSSAMERESFAAVIDSLLLIVSAMLAVAVVIAVVGVANTLSLSVLERRRESATLRALGLTTGQLRGMLGIEGVIIAVVGALAGVVGGLVYGWAGVLTLLSSLGEVYLVTPWAMILTVFVGAAIAGLLASVIPARSAVRVSPVAALAEE